MKLVGPSELIFEYKSLSIVSKIHLAAISGAQGTRKTFAWPYLSSISLYKYSFFSTCLFESMGGYTWEKGRDQFTMGKKILILYLNYRYFCDISTLFLIHSSGNRSSFSKFSEKLVSQNCPKHMQMPCPLHQQHHTLKIMSVSYLYAILMEF